MEKLCDDVLADWERKFPDLSREEVVRLAILSIKETGTDWVSNGDTNQTKENVIIKRYG